VCDACLQFNSSAHVGICPSFIYLFIFLRRSAEARAHASLGYVYELMQDVDKAIDHYELVGGIEVETEWVRVCMMQGRGSRTLMTSLVLSHVTCNQCFLKKMVVICLASCDIAYWLHVEKFQAAEFWIILWMNQRAFVTLNLKLSLQKKVKWFFFFFFFFFFFWGGVFLSSS